MFIAEPPQSAGQEDLYQRDLADDGYVNNLTRLWAWRPDVSDAFTELRARLTAGSDLTDAEVALLTACTAAQRGDSYCAIAWGGRLSARMDESTAVNVLEGSLNDLDPRSAVIAAWAETVVIDPNSATAQQVAALRAIGWTDRTIFEATALIAFRLAFSTVNDALAAQPDQQLADSVPTAVRRAVEYGRPVAPDPST